MWLLQHGTAAALKLGFLLHFVGGMMIDFEL